MKEEKLFKMVENVDDDLICEMMEYSPNIKAEEGEYEGVLYSADEKVRKVHYWKYPAAAAVFMLAIVGALFIFNANNTLPYEENMGGNGTEETSDIDGTMPWPFSEGVDGDQYSEFFQPTTRVLNNIPGELLELIDSEDFDEWIKSFPSVIVAPSDINGYINLYSFITHFDITEKKAERALHVYLDSDDEQIRITREEFDTIFSGDVKAITEKFASAYSIVIGENTYCPYWIYSHTAESYRKAGITADMLIEKLPLYASFNYADEAWEAFSKKLSDYTGVVSFAYTMTTHYPALDLLNCRPDEDGKYRVNEDFLTATDDYELFRKYFFGTWEGSFCFAESFEQDSLIIDDSMKSFNMTGREPWFSGLFYKINNSVLTFICGSPVGSSILWVDMNDPETMYISWGGLGEYNSFWSRNEDGSASSTPVIYSLKKSDIPPNEPEENFLSIFKLYEMSRDYGIDFDVLVNFDGISEDATETVYHDDKAHFYPVYLVSESADKLEFKTQAGNVYVENSELPVSYTIEKIDGNWLRTVDIHYEDDPRVPVDTNIPYEFTEEDKELQKFLSETVNEAEKFQQLYDSGYFGDIGWQTKGDQEHEDIITARFQQREQALDKQISCQYMLLSDELPFKTRAELEVCLKQYFSSEIVSQYMDSVAVGEIVEKDEDYCLIKITEGGYFDQKGFLFGIPRFIEINGRLYRDDGTKGGWFTPNWSMAKVISKTDDEIIFSYLGYGMDDIKEIRAGLGRLKYEDGWKYDWWDIGAPYEMVDFAEVWGA